MQTNLRRNRLSIGAALTALVLALFWAGQARSGDLAPAPDPMGARAYPMQSVLYYAEQMTGRLEGDELDSGLEGLGLRVDRGRVGVEIHGEWGGEPVPEEIITSAGGELIGRWRHIVTAWVPATAMTELAARLPEGYLMYAIMPDAHDVAGEGPAAVGSDKYRDNGADGSGITIGIIDSGFDNLSESQDHNDSPPDARLVKLDCSSGNCVEGDVEVPDKTHGTGCLEAAYDHCPQANWRVYHPTDSVSEGAAIDDAKANGVDILSHSLSKYTRWWADDTGPWAAIAREAAEAGILFFTSAGNRAQTHIQNQFYDFDSDDWHNFSDTDETIDVRMPDDGESSFYLLWDQTGGPYDLDFYLLSDDNTDTLARGTSSGSFTEWFSWKNTSGSEKTVEIAVKNVSGGVMMFEIFMHKTGTWMDHVSNVSSTTSPSNCTHPNVISVGAVGHGDFDEPPGSYDILMEYSSLGPSNSGMLTPDLAGPTDTKTYTYPDGFGGTSCATPNAAGAAGAFWSSQPGMTAAQVRELLFEMAGLFRDWGVTVGHDNWYGIGGVTAPKNHSSVVLVNDGLGNTGASLDRPFYYVSDAYDYVESGGRMIMFGGTYPESIEMTKMIDVLSYGAESTIGAP
jgi:hypothetical protein